MNINEYHSLFIVVLLACMLLLTACAPEAEEMPTALLPAGKAYADGKEIYFVHTEASDAGYCRASDQYDEIAGIACAGPGQIRPKRPGGSVCL